MSGWQLSGYTPVRPLGAGASGSVVLATHDQTGNPVAIKYLVRDLGDDASFRAAFREEARLLGQIDDPHISRLYEYVESAEGAAIVMELVNGVSLRQMLREHGPTTPESALCVLKGSLAGLAAAHARGVVHRDYKPENVLVAGEGQSKLADFGIAVPIGHGSATMVSGTPRYMAPEQWTGAPATPACDIYAATATFFECLTGKPPYDGQSLLALHEQHATAPIPTDPTPAPVHALIRHGLAKQPADRPPHAVAFLGILERVAGAAYGPDWEERGLRDLARRAALLAALWPFPDGNAGATSLATTTVGGSKPGRRGLPRGRKWTALAGGALVAALLAGGAGYRYAADEHPAVAGGTAGPASVDPVVAGPSGANPPGSSAPTGPTPTGPTTTGPTPTGPTTTGATPAGPGPAGPGPAGPGPAGPGPAAPATTTDPAGPAQPGTSSPSPSSSPSSSPASSSPPAPRPSTSSSPPPPRDTTPPKVGAVSASQQVLEAENCKYFARTSTISVIVSDDRSGPTAMKVSFRYTVGGSGRTVGMSSAGRGVFRGTLGPLSMPKETTRIPVSVVAVDAAGNSAKSARLTYVTLNSFCSPG